LVFEFLDQLLSVDIGGTTFVLTTFIFAGIFMAIGVIVARIIRSIFNKKFAPTMSEHSAKNTSKLLYYGIIIITFLSVITSQGIDLSGLIVAGGIFGVVIGFATQSVVSNLISGFFLMIEKPAKIGDLVEIQGMGVTGTVMDMTTFSTKIRIVDGTVVRIPNDKVFTSNIRSVSGSSIRRIEKIVGIGYAEDINIAKNAIKKGI
jgi:small-conductance mechanosensitive channel